MKRVPVAEWGDEEVDAGDRLLDVAALHEQRRLCGLVTTHPLTRAVTSWCCLPRGHDGDHLMRRLA